MTTLAADKEPQFEPLVILQEVEVVTGEEEEEALCTMRAKLYVFIFSRKDCLSKCFDALQSSIEIVWIQN